MSHQLLRPFARRMPKLHNPYSTAPFQIQSLLFFPTPLNPNLHQFVPIPAPSGTRGAHFKPRGLKLRNPPPPSEMMHVRKKNEEVLTEAEERRSRNEKKRLARQAVKFGMELAALTDSQIKRILKAADAEPELFEAFALVKRLGTDVREGKRRQFNYIDGECMVWRLQHGRSDLLGIVMTSSTAGKLLRDVDHELMVELIQAAKDGGLTQLLASRGPVSLEVEENDGEEQEEEEDEEVEEEEESDEEDKVMVSHIETASRWFEGLISKDAMITKEVYSVGFEFDRQELRKLVRNVQSVQEWQDNPDENNGELDQKLMRAQKSLNHFLYSLAKRIPTD